MSPKMRRTVHGSVLGLAGAFLVVVVWAMVIEPNSLIVRSTTIPLARWPAAWDGLRIAAIADVHAGSAYVGYAKLDRMAQLVAEQHPDLVVLLGDYVCRPWPQEGVEKPENVAARLAQLRAPLGVVAVLGNHEWWLDGRRMRQALEGAGIRVLDNEALRLERGGQALWLAGIADALTRIPRVGYTLGAIPERDPVILITHNPDLFDHEIPDRVVLTLAGHTHGGQVRFPFFGPPIVPSAYGQRYAAGLVVEGRRTLFVTTGIGTSLAPIRLGVPPEIALLTLRAAGSASR